jgi:hypothetical protein
VGARHQEGPHEEADEPGLHADGFVMVTGECRELAKSNRVSCDGNRILPSGGCFGSEDPNRRPRDEMSLVVESIMDGGNGC